MKHRTQSASIALYSSILSPILSLVAVALCMFATTHARASLIGVTGNVQAIAPPASVVLGALTSNSTAFVFQERQGVVFNFNNLVNSQRSIDSGFSFLQDYFTQDTFPAFLQTATGPVNSFADLQFVSPVAGQAMDSYFLHFEPIPLDGGTSYFSRGTLQFDTEILGVQVDGGSLPFSYAMTLSTFMFQADGTGYRPTSIGSFGTEGLELNGVGCGDLNDTFEISADRRSLSYCFAANGSSDQMRIVTSVPEPETFGLMGLGLAGIAFACRRKAAIRT